MSHAACVKSRNDDAEHDGFAAGRWQTAFFKSRIRDRVEAIENIRLTTGMPLKIQMCPSAVDLVRDFETTEKRAELRTGSR